VRDWQSSGVRTIGYVSTASPVGPGDPELPLVGGLDEIPALVATHNVEDVIVAITAVSRDELLKLYEVIDPLPVQLRISSGLYELLTTRVTVRTLGTLPLVSVQKNRLEPVESFAKALLEIPLTVLGLLLLWPVLLAIAIWITLDSPGPVFHRRRVLGVAGRPFDAFKFRTMHVNGAALLAQAAEAAELLRANHKLKDDPRVTRAGRTLRRYSLDELPQLFNVLLGQMALVGPRMISPEEAPKYGRRRLNLLTVKPGITGLWQVSGRSDLSYEERVRIDMYYVRNYSVWLDLQILFVETLPAVLKGRGAY
jgi:exopolysaccharide biosynthesis polyprenyl glycosylphosphotransferase